MSHILVKNYVHIIFSTKKRQPWIRPDGEDKLYEYVSRVCKSLECMPARVGGHRDHIHILCNLHRSISLVDLVDEVKIASEKWVKSNLPQQQNFSWQQGYAGFSVGEDDVERLGHYIDHQKHHHVFLRFEDELRRLLTENEIQFDEHLMWR